MSRHSSGGDHSTLFVSIFPTVSGTEQIETTRVISRYNRNYHIVRGIKNLRGGGDFLLIYFIGSSFLSNFAARDLMRLAFVFLMNLVLAILSAVENTFTNASFASVPFFSSTNLRKFLMVCLRFFFCASFAFLRRMFCRSAFFADLILGIESIYL